MRVSQETAVESDRRLRRVASSTTIDILAGAWWYEEFGIDELMLRMRADALALVRDDERWSQLVPERDGDQPAERFRIWRCTFPADVDNSGFVGWLATHIKTRTGSGILVICGHNSTRGGVYDYWGCPLEVADDVIAVVRDLSGTRQPSSRLFEVSAESPSTPDRC